MIIKSFFRKKTTKIYLVIFIILMTAFLILFNFNDYFNNKKNELLSNNSFLIVSGREDYYNFLNEQKNVDNIECTLLFIPNFVEMDDDINNFMEKLFVTGFGDTVLIKKSEIRNLTLNHNEIALGFSSNYYEETEKNYFDSLINKKIMFEYNGEILEFEIVKVYESKMVDQPEAIISDTLFEKLLKNSDMKIYTTTINNYEHAQKISREIEMNANSEDTQTILLTTFSEDEQQLNDNFSYILKILNIFTYVSSIIFMIILGVVIKNIINDLKKRIILESRIGVSKIKIKYNIMTRINVLYTFSLMISYFVSLIISSIINKINNFELTLFNVKIIFWLFVIGYFISLIFALFTKIKNK